MKVIEIRQIENSRASCEEGGDNKRITGGAINRNAVRLSESNLSLKLSNFCLVQRL